jgi:FSR family fosmidomycin resistance protein-like MFS transporter
MQLPKNRIFWSVALGHSTNDIFMSMGPVILASISGVYLDLSPALIGVAISARQMTGAISQPVFGWLSDRGGSRVLGAGGVGLTVTMLMLSLFMAIQGNLALMILFFAASALGSGAFHPVGTSHASYNAADAAANRTALFFLFGQMGLAVGPALAGFIWGMTLAEDGSGGSLVPFLFLGLAAIPSVLMMAVSIPSREQSRQKNEEAKAEAAARQVRWRPLLLLGLLVLLRGIAYPGSTAFIPVLFREKGWSPEAYGGITSAFWIASAAAGVYFGTLADRFGSRVIVTSTLLLGVPIYFTLPLLDGGLAFLMVLAAGAFVGGSHSIIVVMAQAMLPGRKGFASGVALGFIFGVGALGTLALGYIADGVTIGSLTFDGIGLERAFQLISGFVLLSALLGFTLPASGQRKRKRKLTAGAQGAD